MDKFPEGFTHHQRQTITALSAFCGKEPHMLIPSNDLPMVTVVFSDTLWANVFRDGSIGAFAPFKMSILPPPTPYLEY